MPQNSNFWLPRGHRFFPKNGSYGYGAKWRWGPPRVHLGANGVPLGKKMGQHRKKLPCPKIRIFDYSLIFLKKWKLRFWRQVTVRTPYGPSWGQWVKKMGQNGKNYHAPKFEFSTHRGHRFFAKNGSYIYSAKSRSGLPRVHLGANGVPLGPKNGSKRENYHAPKFDFSTTPRSSIFPKKWKLRLWRQITLGTS